MSILLTDDAAGSEINEPTFEHTLSAVCKAAVNLVGVDHSGLVLFHNSLEYGTVSAEYPASAHSAIGRRLPLRGVPLEEKLIEKRKPIVVNNVSTEEALGPVRDILTDLGIKSILVVPIVVGDVVKGSFSFDSTRESRVFDEDDIQKCSSLAEFASLVVEKADLLDNVQALQRALLAIVSKQEREPLLRAIIEQAVNLLKADGGGIDEYDDRKEELTVVAQFNLAENAVGQTMKLGQGLAGLIIRGNLPHLIKKDYAKWENRAPYFQETTLEALIGVPLRIREKPIGVIWLNVTNDREYSDADIKLLKGLAGPASIAMEQSSLRDAERLKAARLVKVAKATNDIFGNLATSSQPDRLTLIGKYAHEIIDAELCGIFLVERPGWLKLVAGHGYREGHPQQDLELEIKSGDSTGLTGHIAKMGDVFRLCGEELRNHFAVKDKTGKADYSESGECFSLLAIPLKTKLGTLRGLLRIHNKRDRDGKANQGTCFTDDDQAIAEIFAQAALVAIETADLVDRIRRGEERYKIVLEVSNLVALAKVPEEGLRALAMTVMNVINRSFCRILFYDPVNQTLQVVAAEKGIGEKGEFRWEQRLGEKTTVHRWRGLFHSLESGEMVIQKRDDPEQEANLDDLSLLLELKDLQGNPLKINYMLRHPLTVHHRIIGLLIIGELDETREFGQIEIDLIKAIANQTSLSIEKVEKDKELLQSFFITEREISASTRPGEALRKIAAQVYKVGRAYGRKVNVASINVREGNMLRVVAAYPEGRLEFIRGIVGDPFDLDKGFGDHKLIGIVGRVFRDGQPIREAAVRDNEDYVQIHEDTLSQLAVPIKDGNDTIGVISVESAEASAFDEHDQMLVEGLAVQAQLAISRERELRDHQKLQTMATAGAAARFWSHTLKDAAKLIVNQVDNASSFPASEEVRRILAKVKTQAGYIETLRFTPLSSTEGVKDETLNYVLEEYLRDFRYDSAAKGLGLKIEWFLDETTNLHVKINRSWFQKALSFFLDNAREAIRLSADKQIEVRTEVLKDSRCRILIKNTGPKVANEIWVRLGHEKIVKPGTEGERGTGILQADLILGVYGGKFETITNEDNNIILAVNLPVVVLNLDTETNSI